MAQSFQRLNTQNFKGGYQGFSSFVDYNGDGHLDIFVTGVDFDNGFNHAVFYQSHGDMSFSESPINTIPRVIYGDHAWGDFDNNGSPDLLYSGTTSGFSEYGITKVFRNSNNGCEFVELPLALPGISKGSSDWVDIDNDGLLDIFLAGMDINDEMLITAFKNEGGDVFTEQTLNTIDNIPGGRGNGTMSSAEWEDLDGDGLPDLVLALSTDQDFTFEIYKNLGGFQFAKQTTVLPKLSYVAMDIGDVNNDSLPDIVFTGSPNLNNNTGDGTGDFYVYTNNGNMNFTNTFRIADEGVLFNDIELGDLDNDGDLDAINYGTGPWGTYPENTKIYRNNGNGAFSNFSHSLPQCMFGGVELGDFDNDNDLDILYFGRKTNPTDDEITYIYENKLLNEEVPTAILANQTCDCDNTLNFSLNNDFDSVDWNFGDPVTVGLNVSTERKPAHLFSNEGTYTVSATFTQGAITNTLTKVVTISGLPAIAQPADLASCSNSNNVEYDFNQLKDTEILNGASPNDFTIFYYTSVENAEADNYRLSMPYAGQGLDETIYARVQSTVNSNCYLITDFKIISTPAPIANPLDDILMCDEDYDGYAEFDLTPLEIIIIGSQSGMTVEFYDRNGDLIPTGSLSAYQNTRMDSETITVRIVDTLSNCYSETTTDLIVNPIPMVETSYELFGCDDTNDGFSEYFDTSNISETIIGNQTNMELVYTDRNGVEYMDLPNPYTNTVAFQETMIVTITNILTGCSTETDLIFTTSSKPELNQIEDILECGDNDGFAFFDTSNIETLLIGNQAGLRLSYFDEDGAPLIDFVSDSYRNSTPFEQEIVVRAEYESNPTCYAETSFTIIVNTIPEVNLQESYSLCDLEPSLELEVPAIFDSYAWVFEDGTVLSTTYSVSITTEGNYSLVVDKAENGIVCENSYTFSMVRSELPHIAQVNFQELSGQNYIEIIASGDGDFEYSIDGINFFDDATFNGVIGGEYTVYVRDKKGCGEDSESVTIIDYPKFFTPNGDNVNDYWQILGASEYPNSVITIYDRYGKLITNFSSLDNGWDGTFLGNQMISNDYWFSADLGNGRVFKGHFTLKR
ncbi:FG-GAP-like repeat-containing protein [Flagellimonas iocasae]|uniref:FG-GAP-like repeat-containing protein n=1 Tax=Flagellimonas iocasae TaxID=2055905 RepID=A0ABW4XWP7_9FLAO